MYKDAIKLNTKEITSHRKQKSNKMSLPFQWHFNYDEYFVFCINIFLAFFFRFISTNTSNYQDRILDHSCWNIVYFFTRPSCGARYTGLTCQNLPMHVSHPAQSVQFRIGRCIVIPNFSVTGDHSRKTDHMWLHNSRGESGIISPRDMHKPIEDSVCLFFHWGNLF